MTLGYRIICGALLLACGTAPSLAQQLPSTLPSPATKSMPAPVPSTRAGATESDDPAAKPMIVNGRRHRGLFKRIGHFFSRIFHGKRRWYTTPIHRDHCKKQYRSYDSKTNSYRAYSGLRRVCVI